MKKLQTVPVVYLAGGMRSGWQHQVKLAAHEAGAVVHFVDPRDHGLKDENDYTAWDLKGVELADIVFGYIDADNPSGAGLALEFGYAHALGGKTLIYVEEHGFPFSRYFGMVRACADVRIHGSAATPALDAGIKALLDVVLRANQPG